MKKGNAKTLQIVLVAFLFVLVILTVFASAQTYQEITQIKKGYLWLQGKAIGKWQNLNTKEHVFSFLTTKEKLSLSQVNASVRALMGKSYSNGVCWPGQSESNCNAVDTAIAKIMLDSASIDSSKANEWLLGKKIKYITPEQVWYFQLTQLPQESIRCILRYDSGDYEFFIDKDSKLSGNYGPCFTLKDNYWLNLENSCTEKTFQVGCNDSIKANFLFKKQGSGMTEWYVIGQTEQAQGQEQLSINLSATYCIAKGQSCDYESTLWTAYSFFLAGSQETARTFIPYLIMKANETENKRYLPQSFLYRLTGRDSYADEIKALQNTEGMIVAPGTAYNKYYDTAIAIITGSASKANLTKTHDKILAQQKTDGSWDCPGCDITRETALVLYSLWSNYEYRSECEQQGLRCVSNCSAVGKSQGYECFTGECCNMTFNCEMAYGTCKSICSTNETQISNICSSNMKCCKAKTLAKCGEINGNICNSTQDCVNSQGSIIPFNVTQDSNLCCLGTCTTKTKTCQELSGVDCNPSDGKSCQNGDWLTALYTQWCCKPSSCVTESLSCSDQRGIICNSNEDCGYSGVFIAASDTGGQATCCIQGGSCISLETCPGQACESDEECIGGTTKETSDARRCCIGGQCLSSCSSQEGTPCNSSLTCKGSIKQASDASRCCIGSCEKKSGFPWITILIIIAVIIIAAIIFFLIKTGKLKFKKKSKMEGLGGFEFPAARPSVMPATRPMPILKPLKPMGPIQKQKPIQPQPQSKPLQKPLAQPGQQRPIQPIKPTTQPIKKKPLPIPPKPRK